MKRISKRVREEAIELLLLMADEMQQTGETTVADRDPFSDVSRLSVDCWLAVDLGGASDSVLADEALEAAALLRDGWNPGDPVIRLTPPSQEGGGR